MSETKFTKGPWYVSQDYSGAVKGKVDGFEAYEPVATVGRYILFNHAANAALIAAAPDLYAALELMCEGGACDCGNIAADQYEEGMRCAFCQAGVALRKARGE